MCRLALYVGKHVPGVLQEVAELLLRAAEHDIIGCVAGVGKFHPDGWGLYYLNVNRGLELLYRSGNPVFSEKTVYRQVVDLVTKSGMESDSCVLIIHARAASKGEPLGPRHAHPYTYTTPSGVHIVFAHNGAVLKHKLVQETGLEVNPEAYTDSYVAGLYIARSVDRGEPLEHTLHTLMSNYTKTAFMTFTVVVHDRQVRVYVTSHVASGYVHRVPYYRLFRVELTSGRCYLSSTLVYYAHVVGVGDYVRRAVTTPLPTRSHIEVMSLP